MVEPDFRRRLLQDPLNFSAKSVFPWVTMSKFAFSRRNPNRSARSAPRPARNRRIWRNPISRALRGAFLSGRHVPLFQGILLSGPHGLCFRGQFRRYHARFGEPAELVQVLHAAWAFSHGDFLNRRSSLVPLSSAPDTASSLGPSFSLPFVPFESAARHPVICFRLETGHDAPQLPIISMRHDVKHLPISPEAFPNSLWPSEWRPLWPSPTPAPQPYVMPADPWGTMTPSDKTVALSLG